jgi:hypothetical protein
VSTFVNADAGDYRLVQGSEAIDAGVVPASAGTYNLTPLWEYVEPADKAARVVSGSALDVGAYEFKPAVIPDTMPNTFSFTARTGVAPNTVVTSNAVTPAGFNAAAPISVTGGSYSINSGVFVTTPGTINPGQNVALRLTASSAYSTTTGATLSIGGAAGTFTVTTQAAASDTTPDAFSFTTRTGLAPNTEVISNTITPTGYTAATAISVSAGGSYSVNGGAFITTPGTLSPGQTVAVRLSADDAFRTESSVTLTIGGVSGSFTVRTRRERSSRN